MKMKGTDLLAAFKKSGSEDAFSELVRRYSALVHSVAKRRPTRVPAPEEVVQLVFIRLAKAAPVFKNDAQLVAWLHRTTVHVAVDAWRSESRRRAREQHAAVMEPAAHENDSHWDEIAPRLDEALDELSDPDRQAVLLRFFERKQFREVGHAFGVGQDAAKMRVSRALERLRRQLTVRGVSCSAVALADFIAESAVEAAPSQLVTALGSARFLRACRAAGAAGTLSTLPILILMSKAKLATLLVALALVGLGVIGIRQASKSGTAPGDTVAAGQPPKRAAVSDSASRSTLGLARAGAKGIGAPSISSVQAELEDAKRELRALLERPPAGKGYPPPELVRVLAKFGHSINEAVPILVEASANPDYETRAWAISGLTHSLAMQRHVSGGETRAPEMFNQARPALSKVLRSGDEPNLLRMLALSAYLPSPVYSNDVLLQAAPPLDAAATEDLLAALRSVDKRSDGFRFTIVDHLTHYFEPHAEDLEAFAAAFRPFLEDPWPSQRLLAGYALASWPGEKPQAVKEELLNELRTRTNPHSYRAASGLGKLGPSAADAVPELLAYAEATQNWSAGYREHALEAACRLQPELRSQYAAIDAKLKQEEAALSKAADIKPGNSLNLAAKLADPEQGASLIQGFVSSIQESLEPEKARETLAEHLQQVLAEASPGQRGAVEQALEAVRRAETSTKPSGAERPLLPISSLILDARVMLVQDGGERRSDKLEHLLNELQKQYLGAKSKTSVTAERFEALAKAIGEIDPQFQAEWRKEVLRNYPWLDRMVLPAGVR
ncbi:MAG: sigma-70 family RNA polymerase sigma factor [Verrucomicrobia bacterium]|nr:sigma-70 family RNA polymerase sigma factor [Verrucomicrobiota bacterium]